MPIYRRKPSTIEAWLYVGPAADPEIAPQHPEWITAPELQALLAPISPTEHWGDSCNEPNCEDRWSIYVETLHGPAKVCVFDWIAKGPADWWPIDSEHFQATYVSDAELQSEREQWQAIIADSGLLLPPEAIIASQKHLAQRLLDLTGD